MDGQDVVERACGEVWEERQAWCMSLHKKLEIGGYLVSDQACAIAMDVETAFCAGAWIAVVVLAMAVIDAQLREIELLGFTGNTKDLIDEARADSRLQDLRKRRNALVHIRPSSPAITVDQQWADQEKLEVDARLAYTLMLETIYMSPWT